MSNWKLSDKPILMIENRTSTNSLLSSYVYNESGLRIKAEHTAQSSVLGVAPNGGERLYLGALDTISWNGMWLGGSMVKLDLLVNDSVFGVIAENLLRIQASFKMLVSKNFNENKFGVIKTLGGTHEK